ncbi:HRDC domain-containing protein [Eubacterium aggregans]|uniref:HRDC domain-containing protein n=1 Tax=Eubacterium aggregans TaxID=81409 RepID=UPI003F404D83
MISPVLGIVYFAILIVIVGVIVFITKKKFSVTESKKETAEVLMPVIDFSQDNPSEQMLTQMIEAIDVGKSKVYTNLYVPREDGSTAVLPLVMLCASGIYVFHYMDMEGWILGREESHWWTHFIATDERNFVENPIWENDGAITDLMAFFPSTDGSFYKSYVVFSDRCELRSVEVTGNARVLNTKDFTRVLEKDMMVSDPVFAAEEMTQFEQVLDVLEKSDQLEVRLQALKEEMEAAREAKRQEESACEEARAVTGDVLTELSSEEREKIREARHIKKYRPEDRFTRSELALRDALVLWRKQQADAQMISVFEIFDNRALDGIVNMKPKTLKELRTIPGFNADRCNTYGNAIITMVKHAPS